MSKGNIAYKLEGMLGFPDPSTTVVVTAKTDNGNALQAYGDTVPMASDAGYHPGCLFLDTNGAALYVNEGDADTCDFQVVTT